jgi:predicted DNA-binding mobile mystery protein A
MYKQEGDNMNKFKSLKLKQISSALKKKSLIPIEKIGERLRDIREALGMTQEQMAKRLKISQPVLSRIEEDAVASSLKTILRLARALECEFMGVIISRGSLEKIMKRQAEKTAKRLLDRTFANMALEKQAPARRSYKYQLRKLIQELIANPGPELWRE